MSETEEGLLPVLVLIAVGAFAASTFLARLGYLHSPATPQKRTLETRERMRQIKELRKIKEEFLRSEKAEFLKAEGAEDVAQEESGIESD